MDRKENIEDASAVQLLQKQESLIRTKNGQTESKLQA